MKVAVGLRRVAAGKRTSGRRAAQIALRVRWKSMLDIFLTTLKQKDGLKMLFVVFWEICREKAQLVRHGGRMGPKAIWLMDLV